MNFVLDASVVLLWLVPETNPTLEAANVIAKVESRGVVTEADSQRFIALLWRLNIVTDQGQSPPFCHVCISFLPLAVSCSLMRNRSNGFSIWAPLHLIH